jgi:hypothetical protein
MAKKIYLRVWQDRTCIGNGYNAYTEELETELKMIPEYIKQYNEGTIEMLPVFEPVEMTEEEFENLPEFTGF